VISNVSAGSITSSSAMISWTTDENSDSQVEYGTSTSYGSSTSVNSSLVTSHSMQLSGLSASTLYHYRVKSKDASDNLAVSGDYTFTTTTGGGGGGGNLALSATASASSEKPAYEQTADKANDGVIDGWPGDYTKEWVSNNEGAGAWLQLNWSQAVTVDRVVLYDRPNTNDRITGGTLSFSNGSPVTVGALNNNGTATNSIFSTRTITWLRFTVTSAQGGAVGLAEVQVFGPESAASQSGNESTNVADNMTQAGLPQDFTLAPVYPNPFNLATRFALQLPEAGHVSAVIYDISGREVVRVHDGPLPAGQHALRWEGRDRNNLAVGSGIYLLRVEYNGRNGVREAVTKRMILIK
jgi:hypothetical protein